MNTLEQIDNSFKKEVKFGIIFAIVITVILGLYEIYANPAVGLITFIIAVVALIIGLLLVKKGETNFLEHKKIGTGVAGGIVILLFTNTYAGIVLFVVFFQASYRYRKLVKTNPQVATTSDNVTTENVTTENVTTEQPINPFESK